MKKRKKKNSGFKLSIFGIGLFYIIIWAVYRIIFETSFINNNLIDVSLIILSALLITSTISLKINSKKN